jgi:hypothetical protein
MLLAHHPGFSCPLCRSFSDLESDVEVDVPEGYLRFGAGGALIGGLEGVLPEEPQLQQQHHQPVINDTSELAWASEAIYISGSPPNSTGALGSSPAGQQQQHASNATPPVSGGGPVTRNENGENDSREGEESEADAMMTSEVEDQARSLARPRRESDSSEDEDEEEEEEDEDDDDEAVDPGARAARRMMYRGRTQIDGEEEDEDEEDEVHAHVASV